MNADVCPDCGHELRTLEPIAIGELFLNGGNGEIFWKGRLIHLRSSERRVLTALVRSPGRVISHHAILTAAGARDTSNDRSNLSKVHICYLRRRFKAVDPGFDHIKSAWGEGYRWTL